MAPVVISGSRIKGWGLFLRWLVLSLIPVVSLAAAFVLSADREGTSDFGVVASAILFMTLLACGAGFAISNARDRLEFDDEEFRRPLSPWAPSGASVATPFSEVKLVYIRDRSESQRELVVVTRERRQIVPDHFEMSLEKILELIEERRPQEDARPRIAEGAPIGALGTGSCELDLLARRQLEKHPVDRVAVHRFRALRVHAGWTIALALWSLSLILATLPQRVDAILPIAMGVAAMGFVLLLWVPSQCRRDLLLVTPEWVIAGGEVVAAVPSAWVSDLTADPIQDRLVLTLRDGSQISTGRRELEGPVREALGVIEPCPDGWITELEAACLTRLSLPQFRQAVRILGILPDSDSLGVLRYRESLVRSLAYTVRGVN